MAIYKRGDIWHVRAQIGGVTIARSTKTANERTAKQLEAKWIAEVHSEVVVAGRKPLTVQKAIEHFLDTRRGTKGHPSAVQKLRVFEKFNHQILHEVLARDIQSHALTLVEKEHYSINTINVSLVYWNAVNNQCKADGYTPGVRVKKLKGGSNRLRFLTEQEIAALRKELSPQNSVYREKRKAQDNADFFEFLLATGARDQEMATLELSQIDMAKNTLSIRRSKGGLDTTLRMSKQLVEILARRLVAAEQPLPEGQTLHGRVANGYLFPERAKGRYNNEFLQKACYRAKLKDVCLHTLRHSAAVRWLVNGLSLIEVQHMLGHKNISSTMCYMHLVPSMAADRATEIQNALDAMPA